MYEKICIAMLLFALIAVAGCATPPKDRDNEISLPEGSFAKLKVLKAAIDKNPEQADLHYKLGNVNFDLGMYAAAVEAYQRCIELNPAASDAYVNLGLSLRRMGQLEAAVGVYEKALELEPNDEVCLQNVLAVSQLLRDWERVGLYLERLAALRPKDRPLLEKHAAFLHDTGRPKDALPVYLRLHELFPKESNYLLQAGLCHFEQKQWQEARTLWEQLLKGDPEHYTAHQNLGMVYWKMGDFERAFAEVAYCKDNGIALEPAFIEALERDAAVEAR